MDWTRSYQQVFFAIYLLLCVATALSFYLRRNADEMKTPDEAKDVDSKDQRPEWIGVCILLGIAFLLRIWKFGIIPGGMNQDGAMAAVDAKALADYGTDRFGMFMPVHFTAWGYGQMSVFLSYCMIPFIKLFGVSAVTARLPILMASMAGLLGLWGIGRKLLGTSGGLILLAFATVNPWHFLQSRWALDCNMFPHVFLLGLCFLLFGLEKKKFFLFFSMVFFACSMYCYGIAFYTVPLFLTVFGIYLILKKLVGWKDFFCCVFLYFVLSWPIYLTMMINAFGWKTIRTPFCTMAYFPESIRANDILFIGADKGARFWENLRSLVEVYRRGDNLPWNTVPGYGSVTACFLPFALLGLIRIAALFWREKDERKKAGYLSVLLFFGIANLSGCITARVNVNRVNLLFYALIFLTGAGMEFVWKYLKKFSWMITLGYLLISFLFLHTYFTTHAKTLEYYYFDQFIKAVRFAEEKVPNAKYCITPVVRGKESAANTAEILTLFAQEVDAEFYQGKILDANGFSYREKYQYRLVADEEKLDREVVYVITQNDSQRPIWQNCILFPCGDYCIAVVEK